MKQKKHLDTHSEFGPNQSAALTGNKEAQEAAEASRKALEALSVKLRDLPTKAARLMALADVVEKGELALEKGIGFNMAPWYSTNGYEETIFGNTNKFKDQTGHACGSVACLAGWISIMDDPKMTRPSMNNRIMGHASRIMGFTGDEAGYFFGGIYATAALENISTAAAVAALRDYAKTGKMKRGAFKNDGTIAKGR